MQSPNCLAMLRPCPFVVLLCAMDCGLDCHGCVQHLNGLAGLCHFLVVLCAMCGCGLDCHGCVQHRNGAFTKNLESTTPRSFHNNEFEKSGLCHVDHLFAINFAAHLDDHWLVADNRGNMYHFDYNEDLHNPRLTQWWTQLRNFYSLLGDHHILLAYVGASFFQWIVFRSDAGKRATESFRQDRDERALVFNDDFVH
ncbi:hypothetical protein VNO80_03841 [Phaseolus coccineus]|uniref:Secreted protein n=1 Tax=Phaseolus coccineus TaxID=3886 RepID=A0AAN9NT41_PHACN